MMQDRMLMRLSNRQMKSLSYVDRMAFINRRQKLANSISDALSAFDELGDSQDLESLRNILTAIDGLRPAVEGMIELFDDSK